MKTLVYRLALPALLVAATPGLALAIPLKVGTPGGESQMMMRCPQCNAPITGAAVSDHTIGFSADLENPKLGLARLLISVTDKSGAPVDDAKVVVTLTMPEHQHGLKPMPASRYGKGRYWVSTGQLRMDGVWNAEVAVTTAKGDTMKRMFTFRR